MKSHNTEHNMFSRIKRAITHTTPHALRTVSTSDLSITLLFASEVKKNYYF